MKKDLTKKTRLASKRKSPVLMAIFMFLILITIFILAIVYKEIFKLDVDSEKIFIAIFSSLIVFSVLIVFLLILILMRPGAILENDLENIYYNKTAKNITVIPLEEIRNVNLKFKNKKNDKKIYGTLIIRGKRRYRINNIKRVDQVKVEVEHLVERYKAYKHGVETGKKFKH